MGQRALRGAARGRLLRLRKDLGLFANLRPAVCYPALAEASSLKREAVEGLDIMIVRELTGGVYFGEPKTITDLGNGQKRAIDTQVYDTYEIERIAASPSIWRASAATR
jgi:3-isopropylmalate dehydrogenase